MKKFVTLLLLSLVLLAVPLFGTASESRSNTGGAIAGRNSPAPEPAQLRVRLGRRRHWRRWNRRNDGDRWDRRRRRRRRGVTIRLGR